MEHGKRILRRSDAKPRGRRRRGQSSPRRVLFRRAWNDARRLVRGAQLVYTSSGSAPIAVRGGMGGIAIGKAMRRQRSEAPLYQQVKEHIISRILAGHWPGGQRLPSENQLTGDLGVSRMTAHRALRELTSEGWLTRIQGAGTFVAEAKPQSALLEIRNIREEITERGHVHACDVVLLAREKASADVALALELAPGAPVFHSLLVHRENGQPIQVEDRHVNPAFAPGYLEQDFTRVTAFEYLGQLGPMDAAEHVIEAVLPGDANRRLLRCRAGEPCLLLTRRTWSNGLVVSRVLQTYPGSRYRLAGRQDYP